MRLPRGQALQLPLTPMRHDLVIFDFDGTLADSFPFFFEVQNTLADRHGFRRIGAHEVEALRHLSPREVMRHVGLPRWRLPFVARGFVRVMRERCATIRVFDGVQEALHGLHARGATLALVTSNGHENCARILGADTMARFAHIECGASMFGKRRRLLRTLERTGVPAARAIYVGDQAADAEAARAAGIDFAAVAWGYASLASLQAHQPRVVLQDVAAIASLHA